MLSTPHNRSAYTALVFVLCTLFLSCLALAPQKAEAFEHSTLFLPFKINTPRCSKYGSSCR